MHSLLWPPLEDVPSPAATWCGGGGGFDTQSDLHLLKGMGENLHEGVPGGE